MRGSRWEMQIQSTNNLCLYVSSSGKFVDLVDVVNHVPTDVKLTRPGDNFLRASYRATLRGAVPRYALGRQCLLPEKVSALVKLVSSSLS